MLILLIIIMSSVCYAANLLSSGIYNVSGVVPNPNYYPNYYNNYYPYNNPYYNPYITPYYNPYAIPSNCYYFIAAYDRPITSMYNRQPMNNRKPIIGSNYYQYANIANGLVDSAYSSIKRWCEDNVLKNNVQDYYLNFANIVNSNPNEIVLMVNCAIKRKGIIESNIEFSVNLNIATNYFRWRKISNNNGIYDHDYRVYEYDSLTGQIIIIR